MTRSKVDLVVVALISGMAGGLIAIAIETSVSAQSARGLSGDSLTLTDSRGTVRAGLGLSGGNQEYTYFYLVDRNGRQQVAYSVTHDAPPRIEFKDHTGRVVSGPLSQSPQSRQGACGAAPTFADVRRRATGRYQAGGGGDKADSAQALQPPGNPTAQNVSNWLNAHNSALLSSIRGRFSATDNTQFVGAERMRCAGNVYCQMAFRQQAIAVLLGGQ